jgi:hypothetical protein
MIQVEKLERSVENTSSIVSARATVRLFLYGNSPVNFAKDTKNYLRRKSYTIYFNASEQLRDIN